MSLRQRQEIQTLSWTVGLKQPCFPMRESHMITDAAINALAAAIFAKPSPWVSEAYSAFDAEPIQFHSADEVARYMREEVGKPKGLAYLRIVYPDMGGIPVRETIQLKPGSVPGHTLRYTWQGWGMITVQLGCPWSRICANSQARAEKWASTCPDWASPDTWNWKAVASHTRRLQHVLKKSVEA